MKAISLRARLLLLVLLAVVPAFALIIFSTWEDNAIAQAEAKRKTQELATLVAEEEQRHIEGARDLLAILANIPYVTVPELLSRCREYLPRIRSQNSIYANIGMVDAQGKLKCSAISFAGPINFADRAWFRRAVANRNFAVGDYLVGKLTKVPSVGLGYPVYADDGRLLNVLYATIDLGWLQELAKKMPLPPGATIVVVDGNGTVLTRHPDPERQWMGKQAPETNELQTILASGCKGFAEFPGQDGVVRINAIEPLALIDGKCVYVRVGVPRDQVYGPIDQRFHRSMVAMLLVTVAIFAIAWFGGDWIVLCRVRALALAARRFGEGDLAARTGLPHTEEELGQLAKSFDEMAAGIEAREGHLAEADRALRRANRAMTVLSAGNRAMLRAKDEQRLLDDMCRVIVERAGYAMAWVGYAATDGSKAIRPAAHCGVEVSRLDPHCLSWDEGVSGAAAPGTAIRRSGPGLFRTGPGVQPLSCMAESGSVAALAFPLTNGEVFGVLTIYSAEADAFDEAEIELLGEAAADMAFGIGHLRDQTRRREAEAANRIKSEFLANMSHELRTPLNAIIGFSDVLKDGLVGELTPGQREYVTDIYDSGRHLLSLINDILDLSKVEAGRMELELEQTAVAGLLENSLSVVKEKAAAHRIALKDEVQEQLEPIGVDPRKTKQIVYNLLSNALKFTPDGGRVTLRGRRATRGEVENWSSGQPNGLRLPLPAGDFAEFLEISVEDTGIGIKPEDAPRLFRPFSQLDSSLARRYEGTGLGLVMVMKMAQLHGGTVAVSSEPGQGSRFMVWLPWRRQSPALPGPAVAAANRGAEERLALVVENDNSAAEVLRLQLAPEALDVLCAASAEEALALMASRHPAVIILDIFLPGMDGWDFLARIKAADSAWADVPVVIATIAADAHKGVSLGAAQVLQKPVSREDLIAALHRLGLSPPGRQGCKVLIVDDDPKAVEILAAYLGEPGYTVLRAFGGKDGIGLALRELPDLLVLDLMMPEVSGFDVVEALKARPETAAIPIVVVTSKELTAADRAQLNGSVATILEKASFDHGRFIAEVRRALRRKGRFP